MAGLLGAGGARRYRWVRRAAGPALLALALTGLTVPAAWALGPPDAPAQPTVAAGDGTALVSFVPPATNGSVITGYDVSCTSSDTGAPGAASGLLSPVLVTGLTNGSTYTCTVTAQSTLGPSPASPASAPFVPAGLPAAPAQPTVAPADASVVVSFTPPANNGSTISLYTATCTPTVGVPGIATGTSSPITVTGLVNGTTYTCTVVATNGVGDSLPSPASVAVVPAAVPDAPAQPGVAAAPASVVVSFTPPANNGSTISLYTATCTPTVGAPGVATGTSSPITVTGLVNGTTYTCTVVATNGAGDSLPSPASAPVVPVDVPAAPAQPGVARGNTIVVVSFVPPADNGSTITLYTTTCTPTVGAPGVATGTSSSITVTGLVNGTTYTCTVVATNGIGDSLPSPASAPVVPAAVPDPPAAPGVARGPASVVVSFGAPADNGNAITGYTASCTSGDGGTPGTASGGASPLTVTGLTNGATYTCTVAATNSVGAGPASPPSAGVVPAAVPAAPSVTAVTAGDGALGVSFTPHADNGSPITLFTATCLSGNGGAPGAAAGSSSPLHVTGLTNGKIYTCKATATNDVGTGPASAASPAIIAGQPGIPVEVSVIPQPTTTATGAFKVFFVPGLPNGSGVTSDRVACTSTNGGVAGSHSGTASPIAVTGLTTGKKYSCTVTSTNARGTSTPTAGVTGAVGAPGLVPVLRALPLAHGLALPFGLPFTNGSPITNYRARCTSTNGGAPSSPLQKVSPIVATNLTAGATYTCLVTAINARGEGPPTLAGPVVVAAPSGNLASCSGNAGTMHASPGLSLSEPNAQTFTLAATYSSCSGPYVAGAKVSLTFHSAAPMDCLNAVGMSNSGSGSFTWTSPQGMGKSAASVAFSVTSTSGHVTHIHYSGTVTSLANVFTGAHVSGNLTLDKGLTAAASGGDCTVTNLIAGAHVTAITASLS